MSTEMQTRKPEPGPPLLTPPFPPPRSPSTTAAPGTCPAPSPHPHLEAGALALKRQVPSHQPLVKTLRGPPAAPGRRPDSPRVLAPRATPAAPSPFTWQIQTNLRGPVTPEAFPDPCTQSGGPPCVLAAPTFPLNIDGVHSGRLGAAAGWAGSASPTRLQTGQGLGPRAGDPICRVQGQRKHAEPLVQTY